MLCWYDIYMKMEVERKLKIFFLRVDQFASLKLPYHMAFVLHVF